MSDLTPTELRANVYQILDEVLASGTPRRVRRGGQVVLLIPEAALERGGDRAPARAPWAFEQRPFRALVVGDIDTIVEGGSGAEWNAEGELAP